MPDDMLLSTLSHLVLTDIDAINACTQAVDNCGDDSLARLLSQFRSDHHRHVRNLGDAIERLGGKPPVQADISGFAIAGFTAVAANAGRAGALAAMESNEMVTNDAYRQALTQQMPDDIRRVVEHNYADEQIHLDTIRGELRQLGPAGEAALRAGAAQGWATSAWMNTLRRGVPALLLALGAAWLGSRLWRLRG